MQGGTPIAPNEDAALIALATFADSTLGKKYSAALASWENAWERFTPFLAFGPALRKVISPPPQSGGRYPHHQHIESLNFQLRKIIKNRGHFPSDAAAIKLLWLAIGKIEDKRARERAKVAGLPKGSLHKAQASSSKARRSKAGKPPWGNSSSSIATASTPTYNTHEIQVAYTDNLTGSRMESCLH